MNTAETLLRLLDMFQQGLMTTDRIAIIRARVKAMTEAGTNPTGEEWAALFDSITHNADRLSEAAKR